MRITCISFVGSVALACGGGAELTGDATDTQVTMTPPSTSVSASSSSGGAVTETDGETPTEGGATVSATGTGSATDSTGPAVTSSTGEPDTGTDATSTPQTSTGPDTDGTTSEDTTTGVVPEKCPCPENLEVPLDDGIFVLSKTAQLWKYLPGANEFELLGAVDCGVAPSTFSMGVDRQGYAWVQFSDLQIRKVDVTDVADCSDPGFVPMQDGIENFGMAFVSNSADDKCDRIYGNHYNGVAQGAMVSEFFSVDPETLQLQQLGKSDYGLAEVTGTGDGRAFLFAGPDPAELVEVDKATGATLEVTPLPGVKTGGGFAFAFFAGDFYFFTDAQSDGKSEVTHIDYDDSDKNGVQDLKVVLQDAPLRVVGAGVSTCAPLIPQ
jgi:hypothetical protein